MRKTLCTMALALTGCLAINAQNNAIFKADELLTKNDVNGAITLLESAMENPKTTKFADVYRKAAEVSTQIFLPELQMAAQNMPFDTVRFCTYLDKSISYFLKSHEYDVTPDAKGKVKSKYDAPKPPMKSNREYVMMFIDYYFHAGYFQSLMGNTDESVKYFEKFMQLPQNPIFNDAQRDTIYQANKKVYMQAAQNLARIHYTNKNWGKAIEYANMGLKGDENKRDMYIIKMNSFKEQGDSIAYKNALKEAAFESGDPIFMQNLLYTYMTEENVTEAEAVANEFVSKDPNNKSAWYMKGCIYLNMKKDYAAARECFQKALDLDPDFLEANTNMAYTYTNEIVERKQSGEFKWVGTGKNYVKGSKDEQLYKKELAIVHDFYGKALPYMQKVRSLVPDQPKEWVYVLQMIYENLNMKTEKAEMDAIINQIQQQQ